AVSRWIQVSNGVWLAVGSWRTMSNCVLVLEFLTVFQPYEGGRGFWSILTRLPALRGGHRLMDDHHAGRAEPRRFFIFVGPAAVIGHRLAAEIAFSAPEVRGVDEHAKDLTVHVLALEVVPVPLGSLDSVTREDERRVGEVDLVLAVGRGPYRDLVALRQPHLRGGRLGGELGV